jgi:DnaJ domain
VSQKATIAGRALVAVRATAALREGIRTALEGRRFRVVEGDPSLSLAVERPGVLFVCEVREDTELLARELLEGAPDSPLVFIGPTSVESAATRSNVRELSADVSVAEVVRVCELLVFGDASAEQWNTPVSQPSLPYAVLPKVSDVPSPAHSIPAPLLPSSVPPNSTRHAQSRRPSFAPGLDATFGDEGHTAFAREVSPELSRLLADAETRVARTLHQRRAVTSSDLPGPALPLSAEVLAALEDPIGDYELMGAVPSSRMDGAPNSLRGTTDAAASQPFGVPTGSGSNPGTGHVTTAAPGKPTLTASAGAAVANASVHTTPPPPPPATFSLRPSSVPPSRDPSSVPIAAPASRYTDDSRPRSVAVASEPTTAPPPRPSNDDRVTVRPSRALSPIPPAPALPRGSWLTAAVTSPEAAANTWSRSNVPTSPLPMEPPSEELVHRDTTGLEASTGETSERAPAREAMPTELPPLKQRGDAVAALATAVRLRFSGAVAFEAEGGIRRVVLREGDFSTAASSLRAESLLSFLVQSGNLPAEVETQLGHRVPSLGRHAGAALVAAGHLAQDELWSVLRAHAEFVIGRIAAIDSGVAGFENEVPARLRAEPAVFGGATGAEILIETLRRVVEPAQALERLGGERVELRRGGHFELLDECNLSAAERALVEAIPGVPLGEALTSAPSTEFACVLYALTALRILETAPATRRRAEQKTAVKRDRLDDEALRTAIATRRRLVENGDYFSVLGVSREATGYDIKAAYLSLRRQLDPSRALTTATLDLKDDLDLVLEVVTEAYEILSDQLRRERYRRAIESVPL